MAIINKAVRSIRPTHPGEMLRDDFLPDYGLTTASLAEALGVSRQTVNEILRERRSVTAEMALRLSRLFRNTPEFWLNAQRRSISGTWSGRSRMPSGESSRSAPRAS